MSLSVSDGGILFAGTAGSGLWRIPLSELSATTHRKREIINQAHFKMDPTIPNGSLVAVEFTIPYSARVVVKTYDLAGKDISSLVNQDLNAGSYRYSWDTHGFARGCYAIRLQAGATTCMKLVQIVR